MNNTTNTPAQTQETKTTFVDIITFKSTIGADVLQIVKNPNTGKFFVDASNGKKYKCQHDIDIKKTMKFIVVNGDNDNACLANVSDSDNLIAVL